MDNQRIKIVLFAGAVEQLDGAFGGGRGAPHARAGGENLEGIGANGGCGESCVFERFGDGGVGTDAQARW